MRPIMLHMPNVLPSLSSHILPAQGRASPPAGVQRIRALQPKVADHPAASSGTA